MSPVRLRLNEVATRDGFQMESRFIPTEDKIALVDRLSTLGYARIEVTSFTSPAAIPALADAEAVMKGIRRVPDVVYTALVPNVRGAHRALACRTDEFNLVMSASETHNLANLRMTREQSFAQLAQVAGLAGDAGVAVNVSLSTAFGCPMEGEVAPEEVLGWIGRFAALGVAGITLCDTTGMAFPAQVRGLCESAMGAFPALTFTAHFHDTRRMGLANAMVAAEAGIRTFDASLGGLGGCPYAPGATGNVATEDLAHLFQCQGYDTGVDLPGLVEAARRLESLVGHPLSSQLPLAGPRLTRHPPPPGFTEIKSRALARG